MEQAFVPVADTIGAGGSVTSPAGNGAIANLTLPAPPAGQTAKYRCKAHLALTGTAETTLANALLKFAGTQFISNIPTLTGAGFIEIEFFVTITATGALILAATSAAVAGAIYTGHIVATRIS